MKKKFTTLIVVIATVCFLSTLALGVDPPKIPKHKLMNTGQIDNQIKKAKNLIVKAKQADQKRNLLLKKFGKKSIKKKGKAVITVSNPVPKKDLNPLKPFVPIVTPQQFNEIMEDLMDMQLNLNNYLLQQQVNMTQQMLSHLNPQNAQQNLNKLNKAIADLSGMSTVVDTVSDFIDDVFGGW